MKSQPTSLEQAGTSVSARQSSRGTPIFLVVYDGRCGFCRDRVARLLNAARKRGRPTIILCDGSDAAAVEGLPESVAQRSGHELVLIEQVGDGGEPSSLNHKRISGGAEAIARIMIAMGGIRRLTALYFIPGLRQLTDLGYRLVARYRYLLPRSGKRVCRSNVCDTEQSRCDL